MERTLALGLEHVERLRKLQRAGPARDDESLARCAKDARVRLEEVILEDPKLAARKDVEDQLWRYCYYKRIEECRKRLAKSGRPSQASDAREAAQRQRALRGDFLHFLDVAQSQYAALLTRLARKRDATSPEDPRRALYAASIHRCHLFTGDLARYRELNDNSRTQKSFDAASQHYREALRAYPHKGNPHNQLAVVAQLRNAMIIALFRYVMAVRVAEPFDTARTNLKMLYETVQRDARKRGLLVQPQLPSNAPISGSQRAALLREFSFRFVLLHGAVAGCLKLVPEDETTLPALTARVVDELALLVRKSALNKELRLAVVVSCIALVLDVRERKGDLRGAEDLAFAVVSTFARHLADASSRGAADATPGEALTAVSVFLEWARVDAAQGSGIKFDAGAAAPLWSSLATLWPSIVNAAKGVATFESSAAGQTSVQQSEAQRQPQTRAVAGEYTLLWEDVELEAFVPLEKSRGRLAVDTLAGHAKPAELGVDREKAATERARRVCMVCDWISRDAQRSAILAFDARFAIPDAEAAMSTAAAILDDSKRQGPTMGPSTQSSSDAGWSGTHHQTQRAHQATDSALENDEDGEDIIMLVPGSLAAQSAPNGPVAARDPSNRQPSRSITPAVSTVNESGRPADSGLDSSRLAFTVPQEPLKAPRDLGPSSFQVPSLNPGSIFLSESAATAMQRPSQAPRMSAPSAGFPGALTPPQAFGVAPSASHQAQLGPSGSLGPHRHSAEQDAWRRPEGMDFVSKMQTSAGGALLTRSDLLPFLPPVDIDERTTAPLNVAAGAGGTARAPPGFQQHSGR